MAAPLPALTADVATAASMRLMDVLTDSAAYAPHDEAASPVGAAIVGADRQYLSFAMQRDDVVFAEKGSFHAATVDPVLSVSVIGTTRRGWIDRLPVAIQWLPALVTAPFRVASGALGRTAAGESALMLTVRATREGVATFVNHSGGQIQRVPLATGESMTARRGAWVAHTGDIELGMGTMRAPVAALTAGAPFWYERATGEGDVFIAAAGHVVRRVLEAGQRLVVKPSHLLAWLGTPRFGVAGVGSLGGALWGEEGVVLLAIEGPSVVYLDTAPRVRRGRVVTPDPRYTGRAD